MKQRRIRADKSFKKALEKLPADVREATRDALKDFIARSRENSLRPEQKLSGVWAIRVDRNYRAFYMQEKDADGKVHVFIHVGPHDDYRMLKSRLRKK